MHFRFLLPFLLCAPVVGAQELTDQQPGRPSRTGNRRVVQADVARAREAGLSPRAAMAALSRDAVGRITVDVFVRAGAGVEEQLAELGARVGARTGEWVSARVPVTRLREIRTLAGVRAVELAPRVHLSTSSMGDIRVSELRRRVDQDEFSGATGQGTVIGIVDTGIDFRHGDFVDDVTDQSRILYLWDQDPSALARGSPPGVVGGINFNYGIECRQSQLGRNGSCPSRDNHPAGHGTHVAGIAAGDGSGSERGVPRYDYVGVAPEADLIIVRTDFSSASVADGVAYIFARAEHLGKPAVVNLSLGSQFNPHDGTAALSVIMDELSGPGRIIVAAAGNDGSNFLVSGSLHGETTVARGDSGVIDLQLDAYEPNDDGTPHLMVVQAFYSPADTFAVALQRPDGSRINVGFNATTTSLGADGGVILYNGTARGDSIVPGLEFSRFFSTTTTNMFEAFVGDWDTGFTIPKDGTWRLIFRRTSGSGNGLVDAYIPLVTFNTTPFFTTGASNRRSVNSPADARRVIAVGGYNHLALWRSVDGFTYPINATNFPVGELLWFSSPGPTRDGRLKPEITAPGIAFSSMSRDALPTDPAIVTPDSAHVALVGTSMSSPHVAGTVALMLSVYRHLTPEQAVDALTRGARRDAFTTRTFTGEPNTSPNASWGFGKLDAAAALANVRALMIADGEAYNISQNPVRTSPVVIRFGEAPRRVDLYDFAGKRVRSFRATDFDDAMTIRWNLQVEGGGNVVNGVYLLVADLPSGLLRRKVFIVR